MNGLHFIKIVIWKGWFERQEYKDGLRNMDLQYILISGKFLQPKSNKIWTSQLLGSKMNSPSPVPTTHNKQIKEIRYANSLLKALYLMTHKYAN
jgi:hypothetical protein